MEIVVLVVEAVATAAEYVTAAAAVEMGAFDLNGEGWNPLGHGRRS